METNLLSNYLISAPRRLLYRALLSRAYWYVTLIFFQFLLFCILLRYSAHFISSGVFFRGLACAGISGLILLLLTKAKPFAKHLGMLDLRDRTTIASLGLTLCIVFLVILPVTVDRSVSVFLLSYLQNSEGESAAKDQLSRALREVYVDTYDAAGRRMEEQKQIGNVKEMVPGQFNLTARGTLFVRLSRAISSFFRLDQRYVNPETSRSGGEERGSY